jgi:hypothetical protein
VQREDWPAVGGDIKQTSDRVWTISAASLLAAMDSGRDLTEFTAFLGRRAESELPGDWMSSSAMSPAAPAS